MADPVAGRSYVIGVDLGQLRDYTAVAVVGSGRKGEDPPSSGAALEVVHLERFRGVRYPDVVESIKSLTRKAPLRGAPLVVDATGVGVAVTDMLRDAGLRFDGVTITAGEKESRDTGSHRAWRVPKRDLISGCQALLQQRRIKIAPSLPEAETLIQELLNFRYKMTDSANLTYEAWREGDHDDLLLALALAVWKAKKTLLSRAGFATSFKDMPGDFPEGGPSYF